MDTCFYLDNYPSECISMPGINKTLSSRCKINCFDPVKAVAYRRRVAALCPL